MTAPEPFTTTRHRCPHCRRSWSKKAPAQAHMDRGCRNDPNARSCATCAHEWLDHDGRACVREVRPADTVIVFACASWAAQDGGDE